MSRTDLVMDVAAGWKYCWTTAAFDRVKNQATSQHISLSISRRACEPEKQHAVADPLRPSAYATSAKLAGNPSAVQRFYVWKIGFWPPVITLPACPCLACNGKPQQLLADLTDTVSAGPPALVASKTVTVSVIANVQPALFASKVGHL